MKTAKFHIYRDTKGEYRWRLIAKNGRIVADGAEGYKRKAGVTRAVDLLLDHVWQASNQLDVT